MTVHLIGWSESTFKYLSICIKIISLGAIGAEIWALKGAGSREFGQTWTTRILVTTWPKKKLGNFFSSWDITTVQNFKQIRVGDVGHSGWFDTEWPSIKGPTPQSDLLCWSPLTTCWLILPYFIFRKLVKDIRSLPSCGCFCNIMKLSP